MTYCTFFVNNKILPAVYCLYDQLVYNIVVLFMIMFFFNIDLKLINS